jgi:FG-GAP repeat
MRRIIFVTLAAAAFALVPSAGAWIQQQQLIANSGDSGDELGWSVALSGDTALLGAPSDEVGANTEQGTAYVFVRSGGVWSQQAQLITNNGDADDEFGWSVAVDGDTAIVGAPYDEVGANTEQGTAYIFVRSGSVWMQQAQLIASNGDAYDHFAETVSISGDTALIGAPTDEVGANLNQGTAYVFVRSGGVWTQQAQLIANNGDDGDRFGESVALSGESALVGADYDEVGANNAQGTAYVFVRSGGVWTQQAQLIANNGDGGDAFGASVDISGDSALVGAFNDEVGANAGQGTAYVFVRSGSVWTQQAQLIANNGDPDDRFGNYVAIDGDAALVGAGLDDVGANVDQGTAYLFGRSGGVWTQRQQLIQTNGDAGDWFGRSVALDGSTALVGAPRDDVNSTDQGSAYVFAEPPTALGASALSALRSGPSVVVRWRSADPTVLGYRLYRGRAGKWIRLSSGLLAARQNGVYRYVDRSAPRGPLRYRLQAVHANGTTTWAGSARA